jgi:hypothetical protein
MINNVQSASKQFREIILNPRKRKRIENSLVAGPRLGLVAEHLTSALEPMGSIVIALQIFWVSMMPRGQAQD